MNLRDWTLVAFTIVAQMSVGAFLVLGIVHYYAKRKAGAEEADRMSDSALVTIIPLMGLGLLASLLHLGSPFEAYKAVGNIGSSWLSREVLFGVLFFVAGALFAFLQWRKIGSFQTRNVVAWLAALFGIGLVVSMSNVYFLLAQPAWNTWATPISFFVTTLLLGALAIGAALVRNYARVEKTSPDNAKVQFDLMRGTLRQIAIFSVILLGIEIVMIPLYIAYLASGSAAAVATVKLMTGPFELTFILRLVLAFIGAGIFGLFLFQSAQQEDQKKVMGYLAYGAFLIVLVAEVLGRSLFYGTNVRLGI